MLREWWHRLLGTLRPRREERDLEAELRLHLDLAAEHDIARQAGPEARLAARMRSADAVAAMNLLRDQRGLPWLDDLWRDVRFGLRTLRRTPAFTGVVVLSLGLGIGANCALFSLVGATLLRDVSVDNPHELVQLRWGAREWFPDMSRFGGTGSFGSFGRRSSTFSNLAFETLQSTAEPFADLFAFNVVMPVTAAVDREARPSSVQLVSGNYFRVVGVSPVAGRVLTRADDQADAAPVAVISHRFWQRRFAAGAQDALGAVVALDGMPVTVVGVMPDRFRGVDGAGAPGPEIWIARSHGPRFGWQSAQPGFWWLSVAGRLRSGETHEQLQNRLAGPLRLAIQQTDDVPADDVPALEVLPARRGVIVEGPNDEVEHAVIFGAIFGGLLLIVCLNVGNLLLSRAMARRNEIAIRLALGAGRRRLIRQLLTEHVTLALAGALVGVAVAGWGKDLFAASTLVPPDIDLRLDAGVLAATVVTGVLAGLFFGLMPALRGTAIVTGRASEQLAIRRRPASRLNRVLLVLQVSASVVLLIGAGLFVRTLGQWHRIDTGFDATGLHVFQVNPGQLGYDDQRAEALLDRIAIRLRAVPGVAAVSSSGPFWKESWFGRLLIDGISPGRGPTVGRHHSGVPSYLAVRHDFFDTLGLPVLFGRGFSPADDVNQPAVAVVDETLARRYFGDGSPLGHRVAFQKDGPEVEIVGVVRNLWLPGTRPEDVMARIYLPRRARSEYFEPRANSSAYRRAVEHSFEVRAASDPAALMPLLRAAVAEIDPDLPMLDPKTVEAGIRERLAPTRVASLIWLSFGGVAAVLTALGLYGLLAYVVAQRTREIGIRKALGAPRLGILRILAGQALLLLGVGVALGVAVSMGVNQLVTGFLFGVTFYDPLTVVAVIGVLAAVGAIAALFPVRHALRVDPTAALRAD